MKKITVLLWLFTMPMLAQNKKLDSVRNVVKTGNATEQFKALNALADYYSDSDLKLSMRYAKSSLAKAKAIKNDSFAALAYNSIANVYQYKTHLDSALIFHRKALAVRQKIKDSAGIADSYNNIGIAYDQQANFANALRYYLRALAYYDKKQLTDKQAMTYTNIGIVYKAQKEFAKALAYYEKAYQAYQLTSDEFGKTVSAGNLGSILINFGRYEESIRYSQQARKGYHNLGAERFLGYPIANIAAVYDSLGIFKRANLHYESAIAAHEKYDNGYEVAETANAYAGALIRQQKYEQSITVSQKALAYAKTSGAYLNEVLAYRNLSKAYALLENFDQAYRYSNSYAAGKDSLFRGEKTKAIAEMATKYETEKKEKQLIEQSAEARTKSFMLIAVSLLAVFVIMIALLLFRQQRLKNEQLKQEHKLRSAIAKIETQNKLQEQRLSISRDLHDNIGAQLTFIISSVENIKYAFDVGNSKLDGKLENISSFAQSTILELRDTIWAMNTDEIVFDDLKARILNFIEKARTAQEMTQFEFKIDPGLAQFKLRSIAGMNLYRTIQEAVNNAVKYARAKKIAVVAESIGDEIKIAIEDDGIGFDLDTTERGNGLINMQKRIESIGGVFSLHSQKQKGTQITILLHKNENL